jgi:thiol-disulfide isomerase/thioredoxin
VLRTSAAIEPPLSLLHRPAPAFSRRSLDGTRVRLRAYRGKVVLLNFWATWCPPCQVELPRFAAWQAKYNADGLQVIAISMDDDPAPVHALARRLGLGFPIILGDPSIGSRYGGVLGLPVTFLIARDGTVAARFEGAAENETQLTDIEVSVRQLLAQR